MKIEKIKQRCAKIIKSNNKPMWEFLGTWYGAGIYRRAADRRIYMMHGKEYSRGEMIELILDGVSAIDADCDFYFRITSFLDEEF